MKNSALGMNLGHEKSRSIHSVNALFYANHFCQQRRELWPNRKAGLVSGLDFGLDSGLDSGLTLIDL